MYTTALLIVSPLASALPPAAPTPALRPAPAALVQDEAPDEELEAKLAEAGEDPAKLMEVAAWCKENDRHPKAREVYRKVIEIDPNHEAARKGLRHHFYDDQWFETYVALSNYKRAEAKRMKEEFGLVKFGDEWVPEADVPYLRMSWVKEGDQWISPNAKARAELEEQRTAEGWSVMDRDWIPPGEAENWKEGMFWCGDKWLPEEEANAYHASFLNAWEVTGEHFIVVSTAPYGATSWARWWADQTWDDLVRAYGKTPDEKPEVFVLNSLTQYNAFAAGDAATQMPGSEVEGLSSAHFAFFADSLFDPRGTVPEYRGTGACYYDVTDPQQEPWGKFAVRHAAALAYAHEICPSWNAVSQVLSAQTQLSTAQFWEEKAVPRWFIYGTAAYCERFFVNRNAGDGEDPHAIRNWAIEQGKANGGLRSNLDELFAFSVNANDLEGANRAIFEAGLVVALLFPCRARDAAVIGPGREALSHPEVHGRLDDLELEDMTQLLGTRPRSVQDGHRSIEALARQENPELDRSLIQYFHRHAQRQEALMRGAMGRAENARTSPIRSPEKVA